jgi:hypothetical protein
VAILAVLLVGSAASRAQESAPVLAWWTAGATLKIAPDAASPGDQAPALHLHAARQEYAPFQIVFQTGDQPVTGINPTADYPADQFDLTLYWEQYLGLPITPEPEIFSLARLKSSALPDGLRPLDGSFDLPASSTAVIWADLYVRPGTPPGDHTLTLMLGDEDTRAVTVTVYPVDLPPTPSMSVIIPVGEPNWTIPFYGGDDPPGFLRRMNTLLLENDLIPGTFAAQPIPIEGGWDFSPLDAELDALPPGALFYAPGPYNADTEQYFLLDPDGRPYTATDFDAPYFAGQVEAYFKALAAYLQAHGRLDGAQIYPIDESRWVGDEPLHGGPAGFKHLADWAAAIRSAGLRVHASGVLPVPPGPPADGWIAPQKVADDLHVHTDFFDAAPDVYTSWAQQPGHSTSLYLNEYGDLIDMPAAIHRGLVWHAYARGVRQIAGYSALEWVDEGYDLVDPWTAPDELYPQSGYGGGALVWPGPLPSLRIKILREGVEDARLLDLYAQTAGPEQAQAFAACLTPGALADQDPPPGLWDRAHTALLVALAEGQPVSGNLCITPPAYQRQTVIIDFDKKHRKLNAWEFDGAQGTLVPNEKDDNRALNVRFSGNPAEAGLWLGRQNWSRWQALQIEVYNQSPYFSMLDVGLTDQDGDFVLLRNGAILLGPDSRRTLTLPLAVPIDYEGTFDWSAIKYVNLQVNTTTEQTDGSGVTKTYPLGARTLVFDNFALVR